MPVFGHNKFVYSKIIDGRKHTSPPTSLTGQMLWREFYYTCGAYTPNFDRMVGNPVCKQIPWKVDPEDEHFVAWKNVSFFLISDNFDR
jgi:cryptochrome